MNPVTVADICCGAGLLSAGLERAGLKVVIGIDNDPIALSSFHANFPNAVSWCEDIRNIKSLPYVDVVVGGPPCQPFSGANRHRKPDTGMPNVAQFIGLAVASGAKYWIMEEVAPVAEYLKEYREQIPRLEIIECSRLGARNLRPRMFAGNFPDPISCYPAFENPSKTVMATDNNTPLEEMKDLQGVPSWMQFYGAETEIRHQIGNGVPLQVGEALGKGIMWDIMGRSVSGHKDWHKLRAAYHRNEGGNRAYLTSPEWRYCEECKGYVHVGIPSSNSFGIPWPAIMEHQDPGNGNTQDQATGIPKEE